MTGAIRAITLALLLLAAPPQAEASAADGQPVPAQRPAATQDTAASEHAAASERAAAPDSARARYATTVVQRDPHGTMVAVSIRYPVGSAQDPSGEEGAAFILTRAIEAEAAQRLASHEARVEVLLGRDELMVTLLAPPAGWVEALGEVERVLASPLLTSSAVAELRDLHLQRLVFEQGAPVRGFELERDRLLLGASAPGARPAHGRPESIRELDADAPARFHERHLRTADAVVAVVGPVGDADVRRAVGDAVETVSALPELRREGDAPEPAPAGAAGAGDGDTVAAPPEPLPPPPLMRLREHLPGPLEVPDAGADARAWVTGDQVRIDRELTSAWIAAAWPFPEGTSPTLMEFVGQALREAVVRSPPEPGFYSADAGLEWVDGRPVLLFWATVDPGIAARWEAMIPEGMAQLAESPPAGSFFGLARRRFRNQLLLSTAAPDERSRWLVRRRALHGEVPDLESEIWGLTMDGLARAAQAAGPPRTLLFGPLEMILRAEPPPGDEPPPNGAPSASDERPRDDDSRPGRGKPPEGR